MAMPHFQLLIYYLYIFVNMNIAALNIHIQVFVWTYVFISLGNGTAGLFDKSRFGILRNCPTFQSGCTVLFLPSKVGGFWLLCTLTSAC